MTLTLGDWPLYHYRATLLRVVDGDTVRAEIQLGLRVSREVSLRIADIDAPELFGPRATPEGQTSAELLHSLITGRTLYVATEKDRKSFDRYIAALYIEGPAGTLVSVGKAMMESGGAVPA